MHGRALACWHPDARPTSTATLCSASCPTACLQEQGEGSFGLERVVLPFSALAGWGIVVVGVLSSLHVCGVNIQPLLTVGGVGGLAVGFGAQAVTSNAISGINLVGRPLCTALLRSPASRQHAWPRSSATASLLAG